MDNAEIYFDKKYKELIYTFYTAIFSDKESMDDFVLQVLSSKDDNAARRMMNNIMQLISLSDDINIIRPNRDPLRIFFMRTCQEAVYKIYNEKMEQDCRIKIENFFTDFFPIEGQNYVKKHFLFLGVDYNKQPDLKKKKYLDNKEWYDLEMTDFSLLFFKIRGMVTHEGDYWSFQLFSRNNEEMAYSTSIHTDEKILECVECEKGEKYTYFFETTMHYNIFRNYFVEGCLNIIKLYLEII